MTKDLNLIEQYLARHSISEDSIKRFGIQLNEDKQTIEIPVYGPDNGWVFSKFRHLDPKYQQDYGKFSATPGSHPMLFAYNLASDKDTVVMTEGEFDAIRLWQEEIPAVTTTGGVGVITPEMCSLLAGKQVYVCLDNDKADKKRIKETGITLQEAGAIPLILSIPDPHKDVCDFFTNSEDPLSAFKQLMAEAKPFEDWLEANRPEEFTILTGEAFMNTEFPPNSWLIKGLVKRHGFTAISGEGGTGKSLVALSMILSILAQRPWLDRFDVDEQVPVLLLDKENELADLQERLRYLGLQENMPFFTLRYPHEYQTIDKDLELSDFSKYLQSFVEKHNIGLVLIDSLVDFFWGNENQSTDVTANFDTLRQIFPNCCILFIHHEVKQGIVKRSASQRVRGSSNIVAQLSTQIAVSRDPVGQDILIIEVGKNRTGGKITPFRIKMETSPFPQDQPNPNKSPTVVTGFSHQGEVSFSETVLDTALNVITTYFNQHPTAVHPVTEIAEMLQKSNGIGVQTVRQALSTLKGNGLLSVKSGAKGKKFYQLIPIGDND